MNTDTDQGRFNTEDAETAEFLIQQISSVTSANSVLTGIDSDQGWLAANECENDQGRPCSLTTKCANQHEVIWTRKLSLLPPVQMNWNIRIESECPQVPFLSALSANPVLNCFSGVEPTAP